MSIKKKVEFGVTSEVSAARSKEITNRHLDRVAEQMELRKKKVAEAAAKSAGQQNNSDEKDE